MSSLKASETYSWRRKTPGLKLVASFYRRFFRNSGAASGNAFRFSEKEHGAIAAAMVLSPDKNFL